MTFSEYESATNPIWARYYAARNAMICFYGDGEPPACNPACSKALDSLALWLEVKLKPHKLAYDLAAMGNGLEPKFHTRENIAPEIAKGKAMASERKSALAAFDLEFLPC